jgi:hypothetical protein
MGSWRRGLRYVQRPRGESERSQILSRSVGPGACVQPQCCPASLTWGERRGWERAMTSELPSKTEVLVPQLPVPVSVHNSVNTDKWGSPQPPLHLPILCIHSHPPMCGVSSFMIEAPLSHTSGPGPSRFITENLPGARLRSSKGVCDSNFSSPFTQGGDRGSNQGSWRLV